MKKFLSTMFTLLAFMVLAFSFETQADAATVKNTYSIVQTSPQAMSVTLATVDYQPDVSLTSSNSLSKFNFVYADNFKCAANQEVAYVNKGLSGLYAYNTYNSLNTFNLSSFQTTADNQEYFAPGNRKTLTNNLLS